MGKRRAEIITIRIDTSGAAFDDEPATEIARILSRIRKEAHDGTIRDCTIIDINGNTCGAVKIRRKS